MKFRITDAQRREWEEEFAAAARRPLEQRLKYAFIKTYKPVLDDAPSRSFETMAAAGCFYFRADCDRTHNS